MKRKSIMHGLARVIALGTLAAVASFASATVIDTTGAKLGSAFSFGAPNTSTYGQTLNNLTGDTVLDSFSMYLDGRQGGAGTLDVRGYVADWDGVKATGILYESATQTMNAAGALQEFAFNTGGLNLVQGNDYVFFLSISNLSPQAVSTFAMPANNDQIDGKFVWMNNGLNFGNLLSQNWSSGLNCCGLGAQDDVWIKANFSAVPAPAAILLFGMGLFGLGVVRRR